MSAKVFVPPRTCWVASGACFEEGRCLHQCQPKLAKADARAELAKAMELLKEIHDYTLMFRSMTGYVNDSPIANAMAEAKKMIERHEQ